MSKRSSQIIEPYTAPLTGGKENTVTTQKPFFSSAGRAVLVAVCLQAGLLLLPSFALGEKVIYSDTDGTLQPEPGFAGSNLSTFFPGNKDTPGSAGNTVIINYSTRDNPANIYGGLSQFDAAAGNTVIIFNTKSSALTNNTVVYGGFSEQDSVTNNTVTMHGGFAAELMGGQVGTSAVPTSGTVTGNAVYLYGGKVADLAGGKTYPGAGTVSNNHIYIYGGEVTNEVLAGWSNGGTDIVTNNSINIFNSPELSGATLTGSKALDWQTTGNTLNLYTRAGIKGLGGFQNYNFYLPATTADGDVMLTVADPLGTQPKTNIDATTVHVGVQGGRSPLAVGNTVTLIHDTGAGITGTPKNSKTAGEGMQGITQGFEFDLTTTANSLLATVTKVGRDEHIQAQLKSLAESRMAGIGILTQGADLLHTQGITQLRAGAAGATGSGPVAFGVMGGSSLRYNSGSHVDVDSLNLATGLGWSIPLNEGRNGSLLLGAFFEAGWGSYDSHNSFSSGSVKGDGDTSYYGGGLLSRYDSAPTGPGTIYAEASFRAGRVKTDYDSSDFKSASGDKVDFDSSAAYYGIHAGVGYIWTINEQTSLDMSTKYLWTRQDSDSVTIHGDRIHFKAMDSHRWRTGAKLAHSMETETGLSFTPYIGAAYEHEFDSKGKAAANGDAIDSPDLKGDTGIAELGLSFKPSASSGLSLDLGVQGYTGKREGVGGSLQVKFEF